MNSAHPSRRFRTNPIEVAIFSVVTLVFVNSLYRLLTDRAATDTAVLVKMASNPILGRIPDRAPAAIQSMQSSDSLATIEIGCQPGSPLTVSAPKARLSGPLCQISTEGALQAASGGDSRRLISAKIANLTTQHHAAVFIQSDSSRFLTDFLPFNSGKNSIRMELRFAGDEAPVVREIGVLRK